MASLVPTVSERLVEVLTFRLRLLRMAEIAQIYFMHTLQPMTRAQSHLRLMKRQGLVHITYEMVPETINLDGPLLDWYPDNWEPNFHQLAWKAEKRLMVPTVATLVVGATKKAQQRTGGPIGSRPLRSQEVTHDLMVSKVFATLSQTRPDLARTWKPEDAILQDVVRDRGHTWSETIPDAVIRDSSGEIVIEVLGRYSPQKIKRIHQAHCQKRFQLW